MTNRSLREIPECIQWVHARAEKCEDHWLAELLKAFFKICPDITSGRCVDDSWCDLVPDRIQQPGHHDVFIA